MEYTSKCRQTHLVKGIWNCKYVWVWFDLNAVATFAKFSDDMHLKIPTSVHYIQLIA